MAPIYDSIPTNHTFYYLDLTLKWALDRRLREFNDRAAVSTELRHAYQTVDCAQDFTDWKMRFAPMKFQRPRPYDASRFVFLAPIFVPRSLTICFFFPGVEETAVEVEEVVVGTGRETTTRSTRSRRDRRRRNRPSKQSPRPRMT